MGLTGFINVFTPFFMAMGILLGLVLGVKFSQPKKNQVLKCDPQNKTGEEYEVDREYSMTVECKPLRKDGVVNRFIKYMPAYNVLIKGGLLGRIVKVTKYLGKVGTAYTQELEGDRKATTEDETNIIHKFLIDKFTTKESPKKHLDYITESSIELSDRIKNLKQAGIIENACRLPQAIQTLWGKEFYDSIPEPQKGLLDESRLGVTIDLQESSTPWGFRSISEEDLKTEEDRKASKTFWKAQEDAEKREKMDIIMYLGTGALIMLVISILLEWVKLA